MPGASWGRQLRIERRGPLTADFAPGWGAGPLPQAPCNPLRFYRYPTRAQETEIAGAYLHQKPPPSRPAFPLPVLIHRSTRTQRSAAFWA